MKKEEKQIAEMVLRDGEIIDTFKFKMLDQVSDNKFKMIQGITYTVKYLNELYTITTHNGEVIYFLHLINREEA